MVLDPPNTMIQRSFMVQSHWISLRGRHHQGVQWRFCIWARGV